MEFVAIGKPASATSRLVKNLYKKYVTITLPLFDHEGIPHFNLIVVLKRLKILYMKINMTGRFYAKFSLQCLISFIETISSWAVKADGIEWVVHSQV